MRKKKLAGPFIATLVLWAIIGVFVIVYTEQDGVDAALWAWLIIGAGLAAATIYTLRQTIPSDAHPNGHFSDLMDNAKYTCMHGVKPDSVTGECAWPRHHAAGIKEPMPYERKIRIPV